MNYATSAWAIRELKRKLPIFNSCLLPNNFYCVYSCVVALVCLLGNWLGKLMLAKERQKIENYCYFTCINNFSISIVFN